jgi:RNA polymerase primary sigma factor
MEESVEKVERLIAIASGDATSLDQEVNPDEDSHRVKTVADLTEDLGMPGPEECAIQEISRESVLEILQGCLNDRELQIILARSGFGDGHSYRLEEVGKQFGVTRERIRQIQDKIIKRIRADPEVAEKLLDLLRE